MSAVNGGSVSSSGPSLDRNSPTKADVDTTGSSSAGFTYVGTSTDASGNVWIVLQANTGMAVTNRTADGAGEVFDPNTRGGTYCWINIGPNGTNGNKNWTVRARTTADGSHNGVTFSAGTGGGPVRA